MQKLTTTMLCAFLIPVAAQAASAQKIKPVTVSLKTAQGQDAGTLTLKQAKTGVQVSGKLMNLTPGDHGIHVHQKAACDAPDFKSAGGHFNPDNKQHGSKNPAGPHAGDMPANLTIGADGSGKVNFVATGISLKPDAANSILANGGTSIIVHEKADDMMTDPSGNSGARVACGVVGSSMSM